jgi:hypothetical protein
MRIHACAAAVASVATLALAPLVSAHGTWWRADADQVKSFAQMQSASTEAPAFHTGDGSIYDSSRGLESTTRMATVPQRTSPGTYERRSSSGEPSVQSNSAAQLDVDRADGAPSASVLPDRPGATTERNGAPMN